jgi:hypothetical protein
MAAAAALRDALRWVTAAERRWAAGAHLEGTPEILVITDSFGDITTTSARDHDRKAGDARSARPVSHFARHDPCHESVVPPARDVADLSVVLASTTVVQAAYRLP